MSDFNPYAPPQSEIMEKDGTNINEMELASRGSRLGAQMLDGLIIAIIIIPLIFALYFFSGQAASMEDFFTNYLSRNSLLIAISSFIIYLLIQGYFLWKNGQTLGKKILKIKIVRRNGERASFPRIIFLRHLIITALGYIPLIGGFIGLIDPLLIFRESKACLHDEFADTKVIKIN